ncbi:MiaB/RimO family radical SAM methylthiotransferase [Meiothermus sp. QL-1]|uniref:MiaB/RimO family radical SAM methylthiotransferase n=1 Tax=Meiothermus sp. QL-1 TaxID=2058095 RepID=UPI000E0CA570|nr:MiaB/RimO family radical SAM methylthiotransferase [Meiothermus sp. QL-1]RDI96722.1 MiaB/RimO family radical SAM methylthiotransferase [Meiothermus sp. QL-1]
MRLSVRTLGCKVNQVESDALVGLLKALDPVVVPLEAGADLVVINTCAVTTSAESDARKEVRRARRANPEAFVVVTGCYAELAPELLAELGADAVVPNRRKAELPGIILQRFGLPADPLTTPPNEFWGAGERGLLNNYVRAFIKVQDGCNAGCAYCIIPRLRGRERHREYRDALEEARALLRAGVQEIVLTGVRLGSYRGHPGGIAGLVEELAGMGAKVRLSSIEPEDTGEELLQVMRRFAPQVRPHLHLSLQTGSDRLLALMGRRYSKAYYRALVERAYDLIPGFALTTDVIAGLPTETEAEHQETLAFLEELRPSRVHVFTYTPRPKTRAASLPQVPLEVRKRRNRELTLLAQRLAEERMRPLLGSRVEVLVESFRGDRAYGHTPDYYQAELTGPARVGQTVWARVEAVAGYTLQGRVEALKEEPAS